MKGLLPKYYKNTDCNVVYKIESLQELHTVRLVSVKDAYMDLRYEFIKGSQAAGIIELIMSESHTIEATQGDFISLMIAMDSQLKKIKDFHTNKF